MGDAPIHLAPYDSKWPAQFGAERALLWEIIGPWVRGGIEHVGSTAVPGLIAKPIIDVMVGVKSLTAARPAIARLEQHHYCYAPYKTDVMHWFCKPTPAFRTHHIHLVPYNSSLWQERLLFRDQLRHHPSLARDYAALKEDLACRHRDDREAYTQSKGAFIGAVLTGGSPAQAANAGPAPVTL